MIRANLAAIARLLAPFRRLSAALCVLLLAAATLTAAACSAGRGEGPAIWRLADADSEIWILGTVHVLPPDLDWRTPRIDEAFRAADTLVFETDVSSPQAMAEVERLFLEHGRDMSGVTLSMKLSDDDWRRFERVAQSYGLQAAAFEQFRPWFAALQISILAAANEGQSPEFGVETVLEAEAGDKRRGYLETAEEQIGVFVSLSPEAELDFLIATLRQIEEEPNLLREMDRAWVRGDTAALARMFEEEIAESGPEVHQALIVARNTRWTPQIEAMLRGSGRIFIAVGAAHLVGPDSVIAQLRARGYEVEGP